MHLLEQVIELRLSIANLVPFSRETSSTSITTYKFTYNSGWITVEEKNGSFKYSGIVKFQCHLTSPRRDWNYNLLALNKNQVLDLSKPHDFNGIKYAATNICYSLEMDNGPYWKKLISKLENRDLHERTLSLFFDRNTINNSNYREVERSGQKMLYITIHPLIFLVKSEVYWLPEAGLPIEVKLLNNPADNFGFYGGDKLYPVSEMRIKYWSSEYSALTFYSNDTPQHEIGNQSVKRVMLALENLEGVNTWVTGINSIADVKLKWDLILEVNDNFYPLQVKSRYEDAVEAYSEYRELWQEGKIPFLPVILWTNSGSYIDAMTESLSKLLNVPVKSSKLFTNVESEINKEVEQRNYKHIDEIRTGKKAHRSMVTALMSAAEKGDWDKQAEQLLQEIVDRGKNPHYQLINHCYCIGKARLLQHKVLQEKLENKEQK